MQLSLKKISLSYDSMFILLILYNELIDQTSVIISSLSGDVSFLLSALIVILFIAFLLTKIKDIPLKALLVFLAVFFLLLQSMHNNTTSEYMSNVLSLTMFRRIWLIALAFSVETAPERRIQQLVKVAYFVLSINSLMILFGLLPAEYLRENYMTIGYNNSLWWCFCLQHLFQSKERKIIELGFCIMTAGIIFFYGGRGAVIVLMVFLVYCFAKYVRGKQKTLWLILMSILTVLLIVIGEALFNRLIIFISGNLNSRNAINVLNHAFFSSNSRLRIYERCIQAIMEKPLFGYGVGYDRVIGGGIGLYAHNLILELLIDFGIVGGIPIIIVIIATGFKGLKQKTPWNLLFAPFFIKSIVNLSLSSSLYLSRDFWAACFIAISASPFIHLRLKINRVKTVE